MTTLVNEGASKPISHQDRPLPRAHYSMVRSECWLKRTTRLVLSLRENQYAIRSDNAVLPSNLRFFTAAQRARFYFLESLFKGETNKINALVC